jgi:hypothetical protein
LRGTSSGANGRSAAMGPMVAFSSVALRSHLALVGASRCLRCRSSIHPAGSDGRTVIAPAGERNPEAEPDAGASSGFVVPVTLRLCSSDASGSGCVTGRPCTASWFAPRARERLGASSYPRPGPKVHSRARHALVGVVNLTPHAGGPRLRFLRASLPHGRAAGHPPTAGPSGEGAGGPLR